MADFDYFNYWRSLSGELEDSQEGTTTTGDDGVETTTYWSPDYDPEPARDEASSAGSLVTPDWMFMLNMAILVISLGWALARLIREWEDNAHFQAAHYPGRPEFEGMDEWQVHFRAYVVRDIAHNQEVDRILNGIQNDQAEIHQHFGIMSDRLETLIAACARRRRREISSSTGSSSDDSGSGRRLSPHARRTAHL